MEGESERENGSFVEVGVPEREQQEWGQNEERMERNVRVVERLSI